MGGGGSGNFVSHIAGARWLKQGLNPSLVERACAIFLQDVADADNFASVAAYIDRFGAPTPKRPIHFVLTQRPEDLSLPKFHAGCAFRFPGVIPRASERTRDAYDTQLVAEDAARRLVTFLHRELGVGASIGHALELVRVYDGGCPERSSNLSHLVHARDFLFDRKDLLTGDEENIGELIDGDEYLQLQIRLNGEVALHPTEGYVASSEPPEMRSRRQELARAHINKALDHFTRAAGATALRPLADLLAWLADEDPRNIVAFALAPLTGLANLFAIDERGILRDRLVRVFGQLFAWDNCAPHFWTRSPQAVNILKNQFNVDCDTDAVEYVLKQFGLCRKLEHVVLVPTEVLKTSEQLAFHQELDERLRTQDFNSLPPLQRLWRQWNSIKGDKAQIIFDPAVIFLAHRLECEGSHLAQTNSLMDMASVRFVQHDGAEFGWDRPVFQMAPDDGLGSSDRVLKSAAIQGAEVLEREGDRESAQAMHKQATATCERDLGANQPDAGHVAMLDRDVTKKTHWQAALEIKDGELYGNELLALLAYHPKACEARCSHWSANGLRSSSI